MPKNPLPWQSLARKNRHDRDLRIEFDEPTHRYYIDGDTNGWISCTGFIHAFFPHFDADKTIEKMMRSPRWPTNKLYGKTPDEIKKMWDDSKNEASGAGTLMHLAIEQYLNDSPQEIDPKNYDTSEWKYFQKFWKKYSKTLEPYRTEWEVFSEKYKLAGSIDMIYRNKENGTFEIYDWKRSKEIKSTNDWESGYHPLDHLPHTNYWHYSLQLNIYRWFLQTYYGLTVTGLYLIVLHPDNSSYIRIQCNIMEEEVQRMLNCRLRAVEAQSKDPIILPLPAHPSH